MSNTDVLSGTVLLLIYLVWVILDLDIAPGAGKTGVGVGQSRRWLGQTPGHLGTEVLHVLYLLHRHGIHLRVNMVVS